VFLGKLLLIIFVPLTKHYNLVPAKAVMLFGWEGNHGSNGSLPLLWFITKSLAG